MASKSRITAIHQGTLIEYDGPQLAYFITSRDLPMLAIAITQDERDYPMFAVELSRPLFDKYMLGKTDLLSLFKSAPKSRLYFLDYLEENNEAYTLFQADIADLEIPEYYPDRGIFSRSHMNSLNDIVETGQVTERFLIDGKWDARDFALFSGKLADTYALVRIADKLDRKVDRADEALLINLIEDRNWQGGGSYGGFYSSAKQRTQRDYPLSVVGIEYHSPGYIDMRGHSDTLSEITAAISRYRNHTDSLDEQYKSLHSLMRKENLLSAGKEATFASEGLRDLAVQLAIDLSDEIGLPNGKIMSKLVTPEQVFIKVVLSFFRRIRAISRFYGEGRVASA